MSVFKKFIVNCLYYCFKIFKPVFSFQGKNYPYFCHRYNLTWRNERAVEVPIIWEIISRNKNKRVLEIGNVLSHYFAIHHDVVDKYERGGMVINQDIIDFFPAQKYDLIVSISTFEHIGWDETPKEPRKILEVVGHLKKDCLAAGGKIIITAPWGYNSELDGFVKTNQLHFKERHYLKKISNLNFWREVGPQVVANVKYAHPYCFANAIVIGVIE